MKKPFDHCIRYHWVVTLAACALLLVPNAAWANDNSWTVITGPKNGATDVSVSPNIHSDWSGTATGLRVKVKDLTTGNLIADWTGVGDPLKKFNLRDVIKRCLPANHDIRVSVRPRTSQLEWPVAKTEFRTRKLFKAPTITSPANGAELPAGKNFSVNLTPAERAKNMRVTAVRLEDNKLVWNGEIDRSVKAVAMNFGVGTYRIEAVMFSECETGPPAVITVKVTAAEADLFYNNIAIPDGFNAPTPGNGTDFGTIPCGSTVLRTFTLKNTGNAPLSVIRVTSSSSLFRASGLNPTIPKGGQDTFEVVYDPGTQKGPHSATITIHNTDMNESTYAFQVRGSAFAQSLSVNPASRDFGPAGGMSSFAVTSNVTWEWSSSASWLKSSEPQGQSGNQTFSYSVDPNQTNGARTGTFTLTGGGKSVSHKVDQAAPSLVVVPDRKTIGPDGGPIVFSVASNVPWKVDSSPQWIQCPVTGGQPGTHTITCTVAKNDSTNSRTGRITFSGGGRSVACVITQSGIPPELSVIPPERNVGANGGTYNFTVNANIDWSWSGGADWVTTSEAQEQSETQVFTYTVKKNTSKDSRTATITFTGLSGEKTASHTITQAGADPVILISPTKKDVGPEADTSSFAVISNATWEWKSSALWLKSSESQGQVGSQTFSYSVDPNQTNRSRTGTITLTGGGLPPVTHTVNQAAPSLVVVPDKKTIDYKGGAITFSLVSNVPWKVDSKPQWIQCPVDEGQPGTHTITCTVTKIDSTGSRTGQITFSGGGRTVPCVITQTGIPPELSATPRDRNVGPDGGTYSFTANSNIDWRWSGGADWVTSLEPRNQSKSQVFTYTVEKNETTSERSATIILTGLSGEKTASHTIIQAGADPFLMVEPPRKMIGSEGGKISFSVKSNIAWIWSSDADWLTSTEPKSQSGSQTFTCMVDENDSTDERVGQITISGEDFDVDFEVTQRGKAVELSLNPPSQQVGADGGSFDFEVEANVDWNWAIDAGWITTLEKQNQSDSQTFTYEVDENKTTSERIGRITITGGGQSETHTVVQAAFKSFLKVKPPTRVVDGEAETYTITVEANGEWTWSGPSVSWINSAEPSPQDGDQEFTYTVERNKSGERRNGVITFSSNGLTVDHTVIQDALVEGDLQPDALIGRNRIRLIGNNIYNLSGARQTSRAVTKRGRPANFALVIQNDGDTDDKITVRGSGRSRHYFPQYFDLSDGSRNVTSLVTVGGYELELSPGEQRHFILRLKPTRHQKNRFATCLIRAQSGFSDKEDIVKAQIRVREKAPSQKRGRK